MKKKEEDLRNVLSVWAKENRIESTQKQQINHVSDIVASIFSPGKHYYFILNFSNQQLDYVHPSVEEVLGCTPQNFSFEYVFAQMHPEDASEIQLKERAAIDFFYNKIPVEKIANYKSSYTFRIKGPDGTWKNMLHQSIALQIAENGKIHHSLSVHTDISFLNQLPDNRISFIGINGEPSYYALSTNPANLLQREIGFEISPREREVILLLSEGLSSKQIGIILYISVHTVETHRRNLLRKTGVKNTLELAVFCLKRGLI
jgi:DNA-binding CsgD family transcriptional regulator